MPRLVRPRDISVRALLTVWSLCQGLALTATVGLQFPLERAAYQTNEAIDLAVVRSDAAALKLE